MFERETALYYNYFRDYDPQTGRYVQSDPIGLEGGVNTYGYVGANPLSYVDPEGLEAEHTKGARNSTLNKHQEGQSRRNRDGGGEKGDKRRGAGRQRPTGEKGKWPPKSKGFISPALIAACGRVGVFLVLALAPAPLACSELPENCEERARREREEENDE